MKRLSLFVALLFAAAPASAQYNPSPNDPQAPVELPRYQGKLSDFEKVELLCTSDTSGDYISTSLCTAADVETRSLAQRYHLDVKQSSGNEDDRAFTLYVHITSAGTAPRGMSVHVEASRYMREAVDQRAGHAMPMAFPRAGKLVMYQETITGVGQGDSLEEPLRRRLRGLIRQFFADNFKD